jgi:hypothetical protein
MPGVIGASIFSPRPGRGYRFHSLQVEIILVLQSFSKIRSGGVNLCRDLNVLLQNRTRSRYPNQHIATWLGGHPTRLANPPQISRRWCSSAASPSPAPGNHYEIATGACAKLLLA